MDKILGNNMRHMFSNSNTNCYDCNDTLNIYRIQMSLLWICKTGKIIFYCMNTCIHLLDENMPTFHLRYYSSNYLLSNAKLWKLIVKCITFACGINANAHEFTHTTSGSRCWIQSFVDMVLHINDNTNILTILDQMLPETLWRWLSHIWNFSILIFL